MRLGFILCSLVFPMLLGVAFAEEVPVAPEAPATDKAPIVNEGVSRILGSLTWGATLNDVLQATEKRLKATWQENLKELDTIGVDQLRRKMRAEFETVKSSLVRFDVGSTGFESSIVADEMLVGKNESLLQIPYGAQQRYYFFRNDRLWKVVVVRDATGATDIETFVKHLNEDLQSKAVIGLKMEGKKRVIASADWRDERTWASVHDRTNFYNAYLVRFVQIGDGATYQAERNGSSPAEVARDEDDDLNALFAEGAPDGDEQPNVVDQLTGSDHSVDLSAGRVDYNPLSTTTEDVKTKKKPKTVKKKPKAKNQKKKKKRRDSDDIIY